MKIDTIFQKQRPVLSFEIFPRRRGTTLGDIEGTIEILCSLRPDFISITFGAAGTDANSLTIEMAKLIREKYRIEPMVHLTCLNHTRQEILAILERLREENIENILALRGDRNPDFQPKNEFFHASELISFIRENGDFSISGACYPECHPESAGRLEDIGYLKKKTEAGAGHLISQLFFDNRSFCSFLENIRIAGINVPVEAGIMPVINKAQIERMVSLCGASLPDKFSLILKKYENDKEALFDAGMAYAMNQIVDLTARDVDGIHIYTMNNTKAAKGICDGIQNILKRGEKKVS